MRVLLLLLGLALFAPSYEFYRNRYEIVNFDRTGAQASIEELKSGFEILNGYVKSLFIRSPVDQRWSPPGGEMNTSASPVRTQFYIMSNSEMDISTNFNLQCNKMDCTSRKSKDMPT
ncbi:unnamed protein product [Fasciola hepatica]|uniref:Uncharacterized protein n=1 Tax=Fasciola hepatica TaxID=6192 RepID=A0ABC9HHV8_FASHE